MDVIKSRREDRQGRISKIRATLELAFKDNLIVDYEQLIAQACEEWGCTWRYIQDIIKILKVSIAFTIETNAGVKQIIPPEKNLTAPNKLNPENNSTAPDKGVKP